MSSSQSNSYRTFVLDSVNGKKVKSNHHARNEGSSNQGPARAAKKIATHLCPRSKKCPQKLKLSVRETTRGSKGKTHAYNVSIVEQNPPKMVVHNGVKVAHRRSVTLKKVCL